MKKKEHTCLIRKHGKKIIWVVMVIVLIVVAYKWMGLKSQNTYNEMGEKIEESDNCIAPDWAKKIGHEELWKEHHGCNI